MQPKIMNGSKESFVDYYDRIRTIDSLEHIPEAVFEQWIHAHHEDFYTQRNYGWINYKECVFELVNLPTSTLLDVYVIKSFRPYVAGRAQLNCITKFMCKAADLSVWEKKGTWRVPPIVLDVRSLPDVKPHNSELQSPLQLIEGHTRLGYLQSLNSMVGGKKRIAASHRVYLMTSTGKR